jgi:signal transduction histidine kinase
MRREGRSLPATRVEGDAHAALEGEARELREQAREREEHAAWLDQRTRLARDLHDVVGHHVTAMVVQAEAGLARNDVQAKTSLNTIADLGRSALGDLDAMVHALREPGESVAWTSAPRVADLPRLAEPLKAAGVSVEVLVQDPITLDDAQELTVYRIVQESLTNVLRHADARRAWVDVRDDGEHVHVRVSDDGSGPPTSSTHGSGLKGIAERVAAVNGVWTLSRRAGGGTSVDVFLPVEPSLGERDP